MILFCCASVLGPPEDLSAIKVILYYYYYYGLNTCIEYAIMYICRFLFARVSICLFTFANHIVLILSVLLLVLYPSTYIAVRYCTFIFVVL